MRPADVSRSIVQWAGGMGRQAIKLAAAGFDIVARPEAGVVILAYHRIGGRTRSQIDLPANTFADQLAWLVANSRVVALETALSALGAGGVSVEGDLVVLTFDDGTSDWVELVLPALVEHDVPATFYVSTEQVENGRRLPDDALPVSWPGLAELVSTGLGTIGSHTHTHRLLDRVDRATAAAEIDQSIALIEDRLAVPCRHFAYPKAVLGNADAEAEVRARFDSAALAGGTANPWRATDVYRLARTPVQVADGGVWFRRKAQGGLRLEAWLRSGLDRYRYSGRVT